MKTLAIILVAIVGAASGKTEIRAAFFTHIGRLRFSHRQLPRVA
jgi:hypothetical protein